MRSNEPAPENSAAAVAPTDEVLDILASCPLPVLLIEVPSERILAASRVAQRLDSGVDAPLVDRNLEDFTEDAPTGALELLADGRLEGYEAQRLLHRDSSSLPVTMWVRRVANGVRPRHALAFVIPDARGGSELRRPDGSAPPPVLGSTDAHLAIDRVTSEAGTLMGYAAVDLVGQSLFRIIHHADVARLLRVLAESIGSGTGVSLGVRLQPLAGPPRQCHMDLLPMLPEPSFAFALLEGEDPGDVLGSGGDMNDALWRLTGGVRAAATSRSAPTGKGVPGMQLLTGRELDVVTRLLRGDRVPAIARDMFLSQSTVRNHLSAIFRKLRIASQQELIHLLREKDDSSTKP
jgi:DNA-binding CsgD family transcriptional regulator